MFRRDRSEAPNALIWRRVGDGLDALLCTLVNQKIRRIVSDGRRRISFLYPNVSVTITDPLD